MSAKEVFFADKHDAAAKLFQDVGRNNVKCYDVGSYQGLAEIPVHPSGLATKWPQVFVACSGDNAGGCDWLAVVPYRVDATKVGDKVIDLDPVLFMLDSNSGSPHPSGVVAYHHDFDGRTTAAPGYESLTKDQTVAAMRGSLTTANLQALPDAPAEVLNAMHHMVDKYRSDFGIGK